MPQRNKTKSKSKISQVKFKSAPQRNLNILGMGEYGGTFLIAIVMVAIIVVFRFF